MLSAVVDTNIIVGGITSRRTKSANLEILDAISDELFEYVSSAELLDELSTVLKSENIRKKHKFNPEQVDRIVEDLRALCRLSKSTIQVPHTLTRDVTDTKFLNLAVSVDADYLITYDHGHLLRLKKIGRTQILTPHKFLLALRRTWRTK